MKRFEEMTRVWLWLTCGLCFLKLAELRPQGFPFYYNQQRDQFRTVRGEIELLSWKQSVYCDRFFIESPSENVVRKDFYIHEIPEEVLQDEVQDEMKFVMQRRQREQFELDRFVLKMYEEFRKRERDGTLSKFRLIWMSNKKSDFNL